MANETLVQTDTGWMIAGTRVPLDSIVLAYRHGASPEQIVEQFPSVPLASAYRAVAFYLEHADEIDEALRRRATERSAAKAANETRSPAAGIRDRLLARQRARAS